MTDGLAEGSKINGRSNLGRQISALARAPLHSAYMRFIDSS
jgi:hypothetical protein